MNTYCYDIQLTLPRKHEKENIWTERIRTKAGKIQIFMIIFQVSDLFLSICSYSSDSAQNLWQP